MKEEEERIINRSRTDHKYVTIVLTHNYKVITNLLANTKLINEDINEDPTVKIYSPKNHLLFIESEKKPYILASNTYINGCKSGSYIYLITTDNSHIISNVTLS